MFVDSEDLSLSCVKFVNAFGELCDPPPFAPCDSAGVQAAGHTEPTVSSGPPHLWTCEPTFATRTDSNSYVAIALPNVNCDVLSRFHGLFKLCKSNRNISLPKCPLWYRSCHGLVESCETTSFHLPHIVSPVRFSLFLRFCLIWQVKITYYKMQPIL